MAKPMAFANVSAYRIGSPVHRWLHLYSLRQGRVATARSIRPATRRQPSRLARRRWPSRPLPPRSAARRAGGSSRPRPNISINIASDRLSRPIEKAEQQPAGPSDVEHSDNCDLNGDGFVTMDELLAPTPAPDSPPIN